MMLSLSPTNAAGSEKDMLTVCPRFFYVLQCHYVGITQQIICDLSVKGLFSVFVGISSYWSHLT